MISTNINNEDLNQIVIDLKDYEIEQCRVKVIKLTDSLKENPSKILTRFELKITLERLNYLLTS